MDHSGGIAPRESGVMSHNVIASEAKQSRAARLILDCFVAEPVIGPRFARTRWLPSQ
jgi:hypothetical protein